MREPPPGEPGRERRLAAYSLVAVATVSALVILASIGAEADSGQPPDGLRILIKCVESTLVLSVAFLVTSKIMRSESEKTTRGRAVTVDARAPGWAAAITVAAQCLLLTIFLMAGLEAAARALDSGAANERKRSGAEAIQQALERVRNSTGEDGNLVDGSEGTRGSREPAGLIGTNSVRSESNERRGLTSGTETTVGDLLSDQPVLRATTKGPPTMPSVHMRGLVLDRYGRGGILRESPGSGEVQKHAGPDGWIHLDPGSGGTSRGVPLPAEPPLELAVEFLQPSNGIVFAPSELRSIQADSIRLAPDVELWTLDGEDRQHYSTRSATTAWPLEILASKRSAGSLTESAFAALPPTNPESDRDQALDGLRAYAESLTEGNASDLECVLDVVSHLRNQFGYELYDTSFLSPERCMALIERGSGSCSHFASLAAVLLRSLDFPTRIAIGYVAREPLPGGDGWLIRSRDGHAWIEVHFEGLGWLPFDPTPGDETAGGVEFRWAPVTDPETSLQAWAGMTPDRSETRISTLGDWVVRSAEQAVRAIQLGLGPWLSGRAGRLAGMALVAAISLAALIALGRRWGRRSGPVARAPLGTTRAPFPGDEPPLSTGPPPLPEARALMEALDARDLRQGRAETPSAFARGVERRHGEAVGLLQAFRLLLGRASTEAPLTPEQMSDLRGLAGRLRDAAVSTERDGSETRP